MKKTAPGAEESLDVSLFGRDGSDTCLDSFSMEYDEDGSLALARALRTLDAVAVADTPKTPCKASALNGSWYLQFTPKGPHTLMQIRGPMRIEVASPKLRVSGDIYVNKPLAGPIEILRPITERALLFGRNWYPQFPANQYSWYFRSLGVTYQMGKLVFKFERFLWNRTTQEFIGQENSGKDQGFMQLECFEGNILNHPALPQPTLRLTGMAHIGGEPYDVVATKTSPFYRGCAVEVDVMTNRTFPLSATTVDGTAVSFASIYRSAGMDCAVTVDQNNLLDDPQLSTVELQTALSTNRRPAINLDAWRLWLLVGSRQGDLFGLMFDDIEPFREGTAGFFDPMLGNSSFISPAARNKRLGEVSEAFLRTLVHEAGHAFNLFHPKHDVHNVPIGTTIMNQTGDVMGFATEVSPYPGNITFAFDEHNRTSLIHSPDPQVAPGWKRFGWGHGSLSGGIAEPVDAAGFLHTEDEQLDLSLELTVPENIFRGQFVAAQFVVTNNGPEPRIITSAINLSQGDLRLLFKPPTEELHDVRDVIVACGDRPLVKLEPGEKLTGNGQIFYTNVGFTFRQTGRHFISAELDLGDGSGAVAKSGPVVVVVRAPATPEEEEIARLSMSPAVGRAFAFGDYGMDQEARGRLEELAGRFPNTETGAAAALTLANSHNRGLRDLYSGRMLREADKEAAWERFKDCVEGCTRQDERKLVQLVTAVAAPTEAHAPVLEMADTYLSQGAPAAGDAGKTAKPARATRARKRAAAAPAVAPAPAASDALDFLKDVRRTFARRT